MRLTRRRRTHRLMMNMTPMIDVVFLLLIFFMTVSQVSEVNRERLQLPQLKGSTDQDLTTLTINVTREGNLRVAGGSVSLARLVAMVEDELTRRGRDPSLLTVVVRSDQRGVSRMTNEVIRALGQLGVAKVRIAVQQTP
jgi:biopolymer transport protein ExbD